MGNTIIKGASQHITKKPANLLDEEHKEAFRKECIAYAESQLQGRDKNNVLKDEVDFFAGVMCAMMVVNEMMYGSKPDEIMDIVPPMWIMGPMSGRKYVNKVKGKTVYGEWK